MSRARTLQSDSNAISCTFDTGPYEWVLFTCNGLGAAETVDVKIQDGASSYQVLRQLDGTAVVFTGSGGSPANVSQFTMDGGPVVQFTGSDPAGTVSITAYPGPGVNPG